MNKIHKKQGKTTAKSLGLKSVLKIENDLVVTTFGKKDNPMVVEQSINKASGEKELYVDEDQVKFDSSLIKEKNILSLDSIQHSNHQIIVNIDQKDASEIGMDYLRLKPELEKEFFGKTFYDNVHIQIAYNLLDLKKIIGLHIGNAIQALENLGRDGSDLVGICDATKPLNYLDDVKQKADIGFMNRLKPYFMYFDGVLKLDNSKNKNGELNQLDIENWDVIRILSLIRQGCAHAGAYSSLLYTAQNNKVYADLINKALSIFSDDLDKFNKSFLKQSKMNLFILFDLYNCRFDRSLQEKIIKEYYRYVLYKDNKNLGFSLKNVRNLIIEGKYDEQERSGKLQTIRSKLNTLLDFYLYGYYQKNPTFVENIVAKLRESKNDEDKEKVYEEEYHRLLSENNYLVDKKCSDIVYRINEAVKNRKIFVNANINAVVEKVSCSCFPSLIYVLCKFLDGKEVNELTTAIINKLENIASLINALVTLKSYGGFSEQYKIFDYPNINGLIDDFRMVKNLTSTKRKLKKASGGEDRIGRQLYADAINIFKEDSFVSANDEKGTGLDQYVNKFFSKDDLGARKVRNLLLNNIIKNRRFVYLIKYIDPKDCYKLVHNEKIVRFALGQYDESQMPLNQLQKYYDAVIENREGFRKCNDRKKIIDTLVSEINRVSIDGILDIGNRLVNRGNNDYINHQKQIISLYLTIAYLIVKGVVHTNSLYFIAWHAYERDNNFKFGNDGKDYLALTKEYLTNKKKRVKQLLDHNIEEANNSLDSKYFSAYRNKVVHLNFCNIFVNYLDGIGDIHSYYDIYQYVIQKWSIAERSKDFIDPQYLTKLSNDLKQYRTYQRNFLKIINLPFAYNLARYKNLTIGDLFNDKYPLPKETVKEFYNEE